MEAGEGAEKCRREGRQESNSELWEITPEFLQGNGVLNLSVVVAHSWRGWEGAGDSEDRPRKTKTWSNPCRTEGKTALWEGVKATSQRNHRRGQACRLAPNFRWVIPNRQVSDGMGGEGDHMEIFMEDMREIRRKQAAAVEELSAYPYGGAL